MAVKEWEIKEIQKYVCDFKIGVEEENSKSDFSKAFHVFSFFLND